jgi:hypothetical protein
MATIEQMQHNLIDKILSIKNEELLLAFNNLLAINNDTPISLTKEQVEMLEMSDNDIKNQNTISQSDIDKMDAEWVN